MRLSSRGWPSTSATMFMPKLSCSCVSLNRLFWTISGDLAALQLDDDAHAGLVGLVAQVGDAFELLFADELADARSAAFALFTW